MKRQSMQELMHHDGVLIAHVIVPQSCPQLDHCTAILPPIGIAIVNVAHMHIDQSQRRLVPRQIAGQRRNHRITRPRKIVIELVARSCLPSA